MYMYMYLLIQAVCSAYQRLFQFFASSLLHFLEPVCCPSMPVVHKRVGVSPPPYVPQKWLAFHALFTISGCGIYPFSVISEAHTVLGS